MAIEDWDAFVELDLMLEEALPGIEADVEQRERDFQEMLKIYRLVGRPRRAAMRELGRQVRASGRQARELREFQSKVIRELLRSGYDFERIAEESGLTLERLRDLAPRPRWWQRRR